MPEVSDLFSRLESTKTEYLKIKLTHGAKEEYGPHQIRLPRGTAPEFVKLTKYQELCWRVMGAFVRIRGRSNPKLEQALLEAQMRMRPDEYMAYTWMTTLLVGIAMAIVALVAGGIIWGILGIDESLVLISSILLVVIPPVLTYVVLLSLPASKAKARGRNIDKHIGPAMSFIAALASADVNIDVIFKELSKQDIYGEIKNEAEWITRDTELLGVDILTAISKAAQRTPSSKFQEFLQGVVTTSTSGGQLKPYFLQKAEQFEKEYKLEMRKQLETLGLLAESFVTVVVAFPLFLVVIMAIMAIVPSGGGSADSTVMLLYMVVGLMIPISQFGFIFVIWNMTKESEI